MEIYRKTILIITVTVTCLILGYAVVSETVILDSYSRLEAQEVSEQTQRAINALNTEIERIDSQNFDWAAWNDTYDFIEDRNEDYILSNFDSLVFSNLGLNLMLYISRSGEIVLAKAFDLENDTAIDPDEEMLKILSSDPFLTGHTDPEGGVAGIVALPQGPMLISSRSITTNDAQGPVRGSLIMGRFLDELMVARLVEIAHLPISIQPPGDASTPTGAGHGNIAVDQGDGRTVRGYSTLFDIHGAPILVYSVTLPRTVYEQGRSTFLYLLVSLLVAGLIFGLITISLLDRMVLSRMATLDASVREIGTRGDFSSRLSMNGGDDEVSRFAGSINGMLSELESSQKSLEESRDRFQLLFNTGNAFYIVCTLAANGNPEQIVEINSLACDRLGYMRDEVLGQAPSAILDGAAPSCSPALLSGGRTCIEARLVARGGERIPVEITSHPIALEGNDAVLIVARDITEQIRIEEERRLAYGQIERNIQQFAALGDQIRQPLQVILLKSEMISDHTSADVIIGQVREIDKIVSRLDQGWIESEKIRAFLKKYF